MIVDLRLLKRLWMQPSIISRLNLSVVTKRGSVMVVMIDNFGIKVNVKILSKLSATVWNCIMLPFDLINA